MHHGRAGQCVHHGRAGQCVHHGRAGQGMDHGGRHIPFKIIFAAMATGSPTVSAIAEWLLRGWPYASIATVWRSWGWGTDMHSMQQLCAPEHGEVALKVRASGGVPYAWGSGHQ